MIGSGSGSGLGLGSGLGRAVAGLVATVAVASPFALSGARAAPPSPPLPPPPPPADAPFDYQIGGAYEPATGVTIVARDWFTGEPLIGGYSICYVNAFQTEAVDNGADRPDQPSNWPAQLVLTNLGDDPEWGGEYLVDIGTADQRADALAHVAPMIDTCARKGFDAVEFDNLDSWTRFDGTDRQALVPFGQAEATAYAELLVDHTHQRGLAAGQKNTPQLSAEVSRGVIGFDFAVAEQCGAYDECFDYTAVFGDRVIDIEYTEAGFDAACSAVGDDISVVRRDLVVSVPAADGYVFASC